MFSVTHNSVSCLYLLYCKYRTKARAVKTFLVDTVKLKFVISSPNSCLSTLNFVSLRYLSEESFLRSLVTHQYDLITHKPLRKITERHSNHSDSTARGNVKTPSLLLFCHHVFHPWGWLLYFLPPLTSLSSLSLP